MAIISVAEYQGLTFPRLHDEGPDQTALAGPHSHVCDQPRGFVQSPLLVSSYFRALLVAQRDDRIHPGRSSRGPYPEEQPDTCGERDRDDHSFHRDRRVDAAHALNGFRAARANPEPESPAR